MYTQCPHCSTAFRVTASLLQQAAGRVRCGSCSHAFSALEHLTEEPPAPADPGAPAGEDDDRGDASIETFTDLSAFDDIRIEDTGVEWRVIDDEAPDHASEDDERATNAEGEGPAAAGDAPLPEVRDSVSLADRHRDDGDGDVDGCDDDAGDGIVVEESGIHPQASFRLPATRSDAPPDEQRYDDDSPLPDDGDEYPSAVTSEAPPRRRATDHVEPPSAEFVERQDDLALGEPEDWRELLDEFSGEPGPAVDVNPPVAHPAPDNRQSDAVGEPACVEKPPGLHAAAEALDFELAAGATGPASNVDFDPGNQAAVEIDFPVPGEAGETPAERIDFDPGDERATDGEPLDPAAAFADDDNGEEDREGRRSAAREALLEAELMAAYADGEDSPAAVSRAAEAEGAHDIAPQTEEEMTINMQIDQDLMRLAEEEGFGTTLAGERKTPDDSLLVETIVMEGDLVKNALDKELDEIIETVAGSDDDPRRLLDTYIKSKEQIRGGRRKTDPPSRRIIAGIAVLGILLVGQVVHAYRNTLATYGAFNHTVGSVYRLFGDALVPEWNVRGWRFEATSGNTDAGDEILTIRSRITNQSGSALPYPLLHVALTDRFEEVIGSRVLQPAEYLPDALDLTRPVAPASGFSAVITVESLSSDATGFKLNVCYRQTAAQLRCATEDFRN